jgi:hypothetical protein
VGFEYVDGVDDTTVPQDDDYFFAALAINASAARARTTWRAPGDAAQGRLPDRHQPGGRARAKDHVFRAAVHLLKDLPLVEIETAAEAPALAVSVNVPPKLLAPKGFLPVTYVGKRESYRDGTYGTGLVFTRGQTHMVPQTAAARMLTHPDVYELGKLEEATVDEAAAAAATSHQAEKDKVEERLQEHRDTIANMAKDALAEYAKTHFKQDLDKRLKVSDLRAQVTALVDRFGVA